MTSTQFQRSTSPTASVNGWLKRYGCCRWHSKGGLGARSCLLLLSFSLVTTASFASTTDDSLAGGSTKDRASLFVAALRERGLHDLALEYLSDIPQNRLVSEAFRQQVDYQRGLTLLAQWRAGRSASEREAFATQAEQAFTTFLQSHSNSPLALRARSELATLLTEAALTTLASLAPPATPTTQETAQATAQDDLLRTTARQQLEKARQLHVENETAYRTALQKIPEQLDPKTQATLLEQRTTLQAQLAQTEVLRAFTLHQQAKTYDSHHPSFRRLNQSAAEELHTLYQQYADYFVGFHARLWQGECLLALQEYDPAANCFEDVIAQGAEAPSFRRLATQAHAFKAECSIHQQNYEEVLTQQQAWLQQQQTQEQNQPEWFHLKYQLAEAKRLASGDDNTASPQLRTEARQLYQQVAEQANEYQQAAVAVLAQHFATSAEERPQVATCEQALAAARAAIQTMKTAQQALTVAEGENSSATNELQRQATQNFQEALFYLDAAQHLVHDDTPATQLNEARWLMSWLLWQDQQYHRAAVLAIFLVRSYPEDPHAVGASQVALASLQQLYEQATSESKGARSRNETTSFEARQLTDLATLITKRWPNQPIADTAFGALLSFALREQQFDEALGLLNHIDVTRRPLFQARIGHAMWEAQRHLGEEPAAAADRQRLQQQALELLATSFDALPEDPEATDTRAISALYLVQAYLQAGKTDQARKLLEQRPAGPLALLQTSAGIASQPAYAAEVYQLALQVYLAQKPIDPQQVQTMITQLERAFADTEQDAQQVSQVYLTLGLRLQRQIEALQASGQTHQAEQLSDSLVALLEQLQRQDRARPQVQRWSAILYCQLANQLGESADEKNKKTIYYNKACELLAALLQEPAATSLSADQRLALQLQYGQSLRHTGKHEQAVDLFLQILTEKEMLPEVQKAAAYTLQAWGETGIPAKLEEALHGTGGRNEKGQHRIWGWKHLAHVAAAVARTHPEQRERFRHLFFECWLNIGRLRYFAALQTRGDTRHQALRSARRIVQLTVEQYPDLRETPWAAEFDHLMQQIQQAEGATQPIGLKEFHE